MSLFEIFKQELRLYLHDKWLLSAVLIVPFVLFVIASNIFNDSSVEDLPIGVVDFDNSSYSRELIRYFDSNDKLKVFRSYTNEHEALKALRDKDIYAYVSIPNNLKSNFIKGASTTIYAFYNTQFILIGRSINSSLKLVVENFNAKLSIGKALTKGSIRFQQAFGKSIPITQQITPLYNINFSYSQFLLSIIIPCIWQILLVATIVLNLISEYRINSLQNELQKGVFKKFFIKLSLHGLIMFFWCIGFIVYFYLYLGWPMNGSYVYILFAAFLTILASQAVGFAIYFSIFDPSRVLSATAIYTAPSLAFVGITFPLSDMSSFAQVLNKILPITHYLNVQISQANYGANIVNTFEDIKMLLGFNLLFFVSILSIRLIKSKSKA